MKNYIGKDGIPVREYELTDVHLLLESAEWAFDAELSQNHGTGEKTRRVIPAKVREAVQAEKERIYWAEVEKHLNYFTKTFNKRLQNSPDKAATIALEVRHWETIFDLEAELPMHLRDFSFEQIRRAWTQILNDGCGYTANTALERAMRFHTSAEARFKYLKWLKALQGVVAYFDYSQNHTPQQLMALNELEQARTPLDFEALTLPKATPSGLQALLNAKFEAYGKAQLLSLSEFAADELKRLHEIPHWADLAPLLPIAQQWAEHLERIASETATGDPAQPERANTPPQGNEGDTGAENRLLSYPEVALILAYERISITNKTEAAMYGAKYGRMTATNSDLQLLNDCTLVYSAEDRLASLEVVNNGRKVGAFNRKLRKIEPHLSDKAKPLFHLELQQVEKYLNTLNSRRL